jgi:pimeloyl-ACP methyl ester carboxylesterase
MTPGNTSNQAPPPPGPRALGVGLILSLILYLGSVLVASWIQTDFGRVEVTNVSYTNYNGIIIRAKLFRPRTAVPENPSPGIVYAHGYQNNRETSDAYCIELGRRGFVVLEIDAIGRGNSGLPNNPKEPSFDKTYGVLSSLQHLKTLPFVSQESLGLMGHSLGAEWSYTVALKSPEVKGLVISGFAYGPEATAINPKNMLMIMGKWDEYRKRMTGTGDLEKEWMATSRTQKVIPSPNPRLNTQYGHFAEGTARKVFIPRLTHVQESHSRAAIAEAVDWMKMALNPSPKYQIEKDHQIWPVKEWATLTAMLSCFASLLFLGALLLWLKFFEGLRGSPSQTYWSSGRSYLKIAGLNGILLFLYLPLIFVLFGLHVYVVRIDKFFPLMLVNGTVWWFFWINIIGFFIFRSWFRRRSLEDGLTLEALGISFHEEGFFLEGRGIIKTALLALILFLYAYLSEHLLEQWFIVDFRFWFPFASDLTLSRAKLFPLYFPLILVGFLGTAILLHGQLRRPSRKSWMGTFASWSFFNSLALVTPLILLLVIQYGPLLTTGTIPFVGPGGMFVTFMINLFHIVAVLLITIPISTWFFQLTGKIYLGALVNAALVTWMFVSSQVIAPLPI